MEPNVDVVELISTLLDSAKYKEALSVPNEEKYAVSFKENCWDLISVITSKIQDDTMVIKPSLYGACEELLAIVVQKSTPEEALLEFIEQIEVAKNDAQFSIILTPLQMLLKKLSLKRARSLEWCLNSISTYIENIPIPEHHLEEKERLLMDCDSNVRRITRVYSLVPHFYAPFIKELEVADANINTKQIISAFLISLLGKPLIHIDMDPDSNATSEARQCCSTIIQDICILEKDLIKLLSLVEICHKESLKKTKSKMDDDNEKTPYENRDKINLTTLSGLFYCVFSGHFKIPGNAFPQVYAASFVVHTAMLCAVHLLNFVEYGPVKKAIALCAALLKRFTTDITHTLPIVQVHYDLLKGLVNVAIYSSYESVRKNALNLLGSYINEFDYKPRCMLIKYLLDIANHSGMIGYAITLYKNAIDEAFNQDKLPECFTGPQLMNMIKKICFLPHGAESDLVELADQIITSLNFLRYLAIKDTNNASGIRECFSTIESDYLEKLRTGLNMSKAHYEVKLKDIEEEKNQPEGKMEVSINVGGNILDKISTENKKEIVNSALNAFHLIEGLVARLSECININRMQGLKMDSLKHGRRLILPLISVHPTNIQRLVRSYCQTVDKECKVAPVYTTEHEEQEQEYEENVKRRILEKALEFIPKSGWSVDSLSAGAEAVGYPTIAHGLFPNGGGDLVHYFNVRCNEKLVEIMECWSKENQKENGPPVKFIENAIFTRLCMIDPYKNTWAKAMAIQALPNNVSNSLASLLSLVDDICHYSGDRSVDFNWYMRRVGLAGIYKASELFYLSDNSPGNSTTRSFIQSRIRDGLLIQSVLSLNPVSAAAGAPQTLAAAFVTAKNILGINRM